MPRYLIERNLPRGITAEEVEDAVRRAIAVNITLPEIRWLHSNLAIDRSKFFCEYEASGPDAVREAARLAGIPCDHVTEVVEVRADNYTLHDDEPGAVRPAAATPEPPDVRHDRRQGGA